MVAVTRASLFSSVWNNVFDIINDNVTDPGGKSRWIYSSFPKLDIDTNTTTKKMKDSYPIIIIPEVKTNEDIETFTGSFITFTFTIEIYSANRAEETDSISDDCYEAIVGNKSDLEGVGIFYPKIIGRDTGTFERDGIRIHFSFLNFEAKWYNSRV